MLTQLERNKISETLAYYDTVGVVGRAKAQKRLDGLVGDAEIKKVLDVIVRAEEPGWFWQGAWKTAARAWMLAKLMEGDLYLPYGSWFPPPTSVVDSWVERLKTTSEAQLRQDLAVLLKFSGDLSVVTAAWSNPARSRWDVGRFTDPNNHRSNNFRYIIYAMTPATGMPSVTTGSSPRSDYLKTRLQGYLDDTGTGFNFRCAAYYMANPTVLHSELLSCSIISHEFVKTYRNSAFGFVLSVPKQCLCFAESKDMALANSDSRSDALAGKSHLDRIGTVSDALGPIVGMYAETLRSPDEILEASKGVGGHNELAVVGSISGFKVTPVAIFVKVTSNGMLWQSLVDADGSHGILGLIGGCSNTLGIPVVGIPDDSGDGSGVAIGDWFPNGKF